MTNAQRLYPDLRHLIRVAGWLSWIPILTALALTTWGGPKLQWAAVYVWSAGITIQLLVGASLLALKRSKWNPRRALTPEDREPVDELGFEGRVAKELRDTALRDPELERLLKESSLDDLHSRELLLRTTIVELLLRDDPRLEDQERQRVIESLQEALRRTRATA